MVLMCAETRGKEEKLPEAFAPALATTLGQHLDWEGRY